MIPVETSALVSMLLREPGIEALVDRIAAEGAVVATPALVEAGMVLGGRQGAAGLAEMRTLIPAMGLRILPSSEDYACAATEAFLANGKDRHPAALNFGDCMSYAVAKVEGLPLLYVGEDFAQVDVAGA